MRELCRQRWGHGLPCTTRVEEEVLKNRESLLALGPPHAVAASEYRIRPMKTAFVALTAAAIRCRRYVGNKVVDHVDAVSA